MNTSMVDFGNRWRWRVGRRSWVKRVERDTGSVSCLSALVAKRGTYSEGSTSRVGSKRSEFDF